MTVKPLVYGLLAQLCSHLELWHVDTSVLQTVERRGNQHNPRFLKLRTKDANMKTLLISSDDESRKRRKLTIFKSNPHTWWEAITAVKNHAAAGLH